MVIYAISKLIKPGLLALLFGRWDLKSPAVLREPRCGLGAPGLCQRPGSLAQSARGFTWREIHMETERHPRCQLFCLRGIGVKFVLTLPIPHKGTHVRNTQSPRQRHELCFVNHPPFQAASRTSAVLVIWQCQNRKRERHTGVFRAQNFSFTLRIFAMAASAS